MKKHIFIRHIQKLTKQQQQSLRLLAACCQNHDQISLSCPTVEDGFRSHYLMTGEDGKLLAALSLAHINSKEAECTAFTHPACRRRGYFSRLFRLAKKECEDKAISFLVSENCPDTIAVLKHLGARLQNQEYRMDYLLSDTPHSFSACAFSARAEAAILSAPKNIRGNSALWTLSLPAPMEHAAASVIPAGLCLTSPAGPDSICLHHVKIRPSLRRQGLGFLMILMLLSRLRQEHISHVILHVSGDNFPAVSLYKKAGFSITETLAFYQI